MSQYFIGLDIGTESVGWAVTDRDYRLCKCNGKAMWGVRLFDEAQTAAERRTARIARRRTQRRRQRLDWLQEVFSEEIAQVDPAFYQRLAESKFPDDEKSGDGSLGKFALFADKTYNDRDYHKEFPTIYHLRYALMTEDREFDVRLVYLAVHHIMKHRGHFLFPNLTLDEISFDAVWGSLCEYMEERYEYRPQPAKTGEFQQALANQNSSVEDKSAAIIKATGFKQVKKGDAEAVARSKQLEAIYTILSGKKVSLSDLYPNSDVDKKTNFSFQDDFEKQSAPLEAALGDDLELLLRLKAVYDWALLAELRGGKTYLSEAKIASYNKHKSDLEKLKKVICSACPEKYAEIFRESRKKLNNYVAYTGHAPKGKEQPGYCYHRCNYEEFSKYLQGILKAASHPEAAGIIAELESGTFLPKQATKDNSVIPHQLHQQELERILERASQYLSFLNEKDDSGLTRKEQIVQMFSFRIPYYIGPLSQRSEHAWLERSSEKIFPWNFNQVVDVERSAEKFIERMTAKCSYLGEDILPRDSLLYSKFAVLNEMNNLRVHGKPISTELKQQLYHDLFLKNPKKGRITRKKLIDYLIRCKRITPEEKTDENLIGGIEDGFNTKLTSWIDFEDILQRPHMEPIVEDIIRHIVLFGDDRKLLASWLEKTYGEQFSTEEKKKILRLNYSGWGSLSRQLLTEIYHTDQTTGEAVSIIDAMWQTNNNLMELLSDKFTFSKEIAAYRREKYGQKPMTLQSYLDDSYASPAIKRAIHQSMKIVDEVVKVMKGPPTRVFVEMARGGGIKGKRTASRKAQLEELYKKCGEEADELYSSLKSKSESDLRRDKLYLYYTQMGKCMYSGEQISPSELDAVDVYDIDHIYPQSVTKDDSLDNRVLVKKTLNGEKDNNYPIGRDVIPDSKRQKVRSLWKILLAKGFISKEKYARLTRSTPLTNEELAGFIARQLVQTRHSSKIVAEWLTHKFGDQTEVVYVKSGNVSSFRQDQRITADGVQMQAGACKQQGATRQDPVFVKCREVNDFHHAKDAYLNIVVGNVYHVQFTQSPLNYVKGHRGKYSLNRVFDRDVSRNGEVAWTAGEDGSITVVRQTMRKNNILFTRMAREVSGKLFDLQLVKKGGGQANIKSSDARLTTEKYGGYNKVTGAYFALVEHTIPARGRKKASRVRSIEDIRLMDKQRFETDPIGYCKTVFQMQDPKILIPCIKRNALFSIDGIHLYITSRSNNRVDFNNANQLILSPEWQAYLKRLAAFCTRKKALPQTVITAFDGITVEQNVALFHVLLKKMTGPLYGMFRTTEGEKLGKNSETFAVLSVEEQCDYLLRIVKLFGCKKCSVDLKKLGGGLQDGYIYINKNIPSKTYSSIKLVHQSVTGLFEQEVDLLKDEWA